jgi:hypothetical protein
MLESDQRHVVQLFMFFPVLNNNFSEEEEGENDKGKIG